VSPVDDAASRARLLAAYDDQLRTHAETDGASRVERLGPLWLATYDGRGGFVTYRDLGGADAATIGDLVAAALAHFRADPAIATVEWKTRGHDRTPGLHEALVAHGFVRGERESVVVGEARALAVDVELPEGVTLRRITAGPDAGRDVRAMLTMQAEVFGDADPDRRVPGLMRRLARADGLELWVAEADGRVVGAGRLEPVEDSDFAGIWGGATLAAWRGRGIYRALTAARARSALALGKTLVHSDSTEYSRPILERAGLLTVSTTTPYEWHR